MLTFNLHNNISKLGWALGGVGIRSSM